MAREATLQEQVKIDDANKILADVGLRITECEDGNGGAVTPAKAP